MPGSRPSHDRRARRAHAATRTASTAKLRPTHLVPSNNALIQATHPRPGSRRADRRPGGPLGTGLDHPRVHNPGQRLRAVQSGRRPRDFQEPRRHQAEDHDLLELVRSQAELGEAAQGTSSQPIRRRTRPRTGPGSTPRSGWPKQDGIQIGLQPDAPAPDWAAGPGYKQHPVFKGSWDPSWTAFKGFVQALGKRYSGSYKPKKNEKPLPRVSWWSIWNEPNFGFSLQPQTLDKGKTLHSAIEYRQLVRGAWQGLVATGHKNDTILIGEIAPRGVGDTNTKNWSAYNPGLGQMSLALIFMSQLYCVGQNGKPMTGKTAKTFSCPGSVAKFKQQNPGAVPVHRLGDPPVRAGNAAERDDLRLPGPDLLPEPRQQEAQSVLRRLRLDPQRHQDDGQASSGSTGPARRCSCGTRSSGIGASRRRRSTPSSRRARRSASRRPPST